MSFLKQLLKNLLGSPLTSTVGVAQIANSVHTMYVNPLTMTNPLTILGTIAGIALLGAADPMAALQAQVVARAQLQDQTIPQVNAAGK